MGTATDISSSVPTTVVLTVLVFSTSSLVLYVRLRSGSLRMGGPGSWAPACNTSADHADLHMHVLSWHQAELDDVVQVLRWGGIMVSWTVLRRCCTGTALVLEATAALVVLRCAAQVVTATCRWFP
jgi:hypothetical protein